MVDRSVLFKPLETAPTNRKENMENIYGIPSQLRSVLEALSSDTLREIGPRTGSRLIAPGVERGCFFYLRRDVFMHGCLYVGLSI